MRWITATNLEQWADTLQARTVFPALIADLIRATAPGITGIRFPSGDKGQVRGFDGVLEATGVPPYVPDGASIWEFGVSEGAAAKANGDYKKRTDQVDEGTRKETTFVFVTPRTWDNPQEKLADWVAEKRKLAQWKSVQYIDGSMVEDWLALCPAVAARYSKYELKNMPEIGIRSTDEFWDEFSSRFAPPLAEEVLLAARESQANALVQRLNEGVSRLPYAADSPDEVLAFAVAAIRRAEPSVRLFLEAKTLIVDTEDAARRLAGRSGLVFLPRAQGRNLAGLLAQHGPTVVSAGADEKRSSHELLNRPRSSDLAKAFVSMGFSEQQGYEIAKRCGRSLAVLARQRPSGTATKPEWIDSGELLLPALLASAWQSTVKQDQTVLCTLGQVDDYEKVEAPLRKLSKLQDPPVDRVGDVWAMRASVDAFVYLGHLIGPKHLEQFTAAATAVFSRIAPAPRPDEVFRPHADREEAHSGWLRDGMMNTLLHMAVLHEQADFTVPGSTPQDFVNRIVRDLPGLSSDHRLLASLQDQLALLAEAAPIPFLEALERLLEGDAKAIRPIFEEHKGLISSHGYYYGVLWALEVVAWDPALLLRAATCLARLAEIDPGGAMSNRPINSLRSILLSWSPNTAAPAKQRTGVLLHVVQSVPAIAWQLIEKLLPRPHDTSSPTQRPMFREFEDWGLEVLTYGLVWESQAAVIDLALQHAGCDPDRWSVILGAISGFPEQSFVAIVDALDRALEASAPDVRFKIWDSLRKESSRHQTYAKADWALRPEVLLQLDTLIARYRPSDSVQQATWLFDDWLPDVPGKADEAEDPTAAIEAARKVAIQHVVASRGTLGLVELAGKVKLPQHVAISVRELALPKDQLLELFVLAVKAGPGLDALTGVVLAEGLTRFGAEWGNEVRAVLLEGQAVAGRIAVLLSALDETMPTWEFVSSFGADINDAYWRTKHSYFVRGDAKELLFAIENYAARGRALAALDASSRRLSDVPSELLLRLLDSAVPEVNAAAGGGGTMAQYVLERTFEELRKREDVSPEQVAKLEFVYLPLFGVRSRRKEPLTLHRLMVEQPSLFMDAIRAVFKPASGESEPTVEGAERLAIAAYELIEGLHVLPGQVDEQVDEGKLLAWCTEVRRLARESDRAKVTEIRIGSLLAHAPVSAIDNAWPHEAVRAAIEVLASDELERGLVIERFNMRGVYGKSIGEGGDQERELARQARTWAEAMPAYPRTAAMLLRIAESWAREAERADLSAAKESLRW
jgi:hypothetical protein